MLQKYVICCYYVIHIDERLTRQNNSFFLETLCNHNWPQTKMTSCFSHQDFHNYFNTTAVVIFTLFYDHHTLFK